MARSEPGVMLKMPEELRTKLRERAASERRSMNAQAVVLLERALADDETTTKGEAA